MAASRKVGLLPMLLALRLLGGGAAAPMPPLLNDYNLNKVMDDISRADNLGKVLARILLQRGDEQGNEPLLSTASYNKAVALLFRTLLESELDPMDNGRPRLYKFSVFANKKLVPEKWRGVYGPDSMQALHGLPAHLDPDPSTFIKYEVPEGTYLAGKVVVVLVTPFRAAHWSPTTSQNFNQAVRQTASSPDPRKLPLNMVELGKDLANSFYSLELDLNLSLRIGNWPMAVIICPKVTCGYSVPDGHILLYPDIFEIFPVAGAPIQPEVIAAVLPAAVGRR